MGALDDRLVGWEYWGDDDPFENLAGPMFFKQEDGESLSRMVLEEKHLNGQGSLHGGVLMTFADYTLFVLTKKVLDEQGQGGVTVSFSCDFVGPGGAGDLLEGSGEVVHESGRMLFVRGLIRRGGDVLLSFSGVLRKVKL